MNWVQVRHRLPQIYKSVLVTDGEYICISMLSSFDGWEHKNCDYSCPRKGDVMAWMYLPEIPE